MQQSEDNDNKTHDRADDAGLVHDEIVRSVAQHLRQQGFSSVWANSEGFSRPGRIKWEDDDEGVEPHIIGEHNGSVYVFEIETRDALEAREVQDRWRLLSVHARRHNGKFYLVIPEGSARYLRNFVEGLTIKPEFLKLSGLD